MKLLALSVLLLLSLNIFSQSSNDSINKPNNLKFSILGGPGYTPDYGFVIGGSMLFTFSTNTADTSLKRSVIPIAFGYMFSGGGSTVIRPQLFFNGDKFRIFGKISANNTLENYYGVGYAKNTTYERGVDSTQYRSIGYKINPKFLFRYSTTQLFLGASIDVGHRIIKYPSEGMQNDKDYLSEGGDSIGLKYFVSGLGLNITYDTRDIPANAYSGMLLEISTIFYSKAFGSSNDYITYEFDYRQYKNLNFIGKRKTLAWQLNTRFTSGDVPITELSTIGSPFDLRGYYMGQYRDKNAITTLVEYRNMFNTPQITTFQKIVNKMGFVVWVGIGSTDPDFKDWEGVMPNFGAGLRVEVQPRMNFRFDVGHDPLSGKTLMYFNMTEAF